jgi:hypothetical protein
MWIQIVGLSVLLVQDQWTITQLAIGQRLREQGRQGAQSPSTLSQNQMPLATVVGLQLQRNPQSFNVGQRGSSERKTVWASPVMVQPELENRSVRVSD